MQPSYSDPPSKRVFPSDAFGGGDKEEERERCLNAFLHNLNCVRSWFSKGHNFSNLRAFLYAKPALNGYFHWNNGPNSATMKFSHRTTKKSFGWRKIFRLPCSHWSHTSRKLFGSSVITPSSPFFILHRIKFSSLTVQQRTGLPSLFASRKNLAPAGPMSIFWSMLKETLGIEKNRRA